MENLESHQSQTLEDLLKARADALRHFIAAGTRNPDTPHAEMAGSVHALSDRSFAELTAVLSRLTLSRANESLTEVEAALDRIYAGCYGFCETCQHRIGYGRLFVLPEARRCAYCQVRAGERRASRDPSA